MPSDQCLPGRWIDPEAEKFLAAAPLPPGSLGIERVAEVREFTAAGTTGFLELSAGRSVKVAEFSPGLPGGDISVLWPTEERPKGCVVFFHGGGLMFGTRFFEGDALIDMVERHGVVVVAPEYRLAPENRYPAALDDCMACLDWVFAQANQLDVDQGRVIVAGRSAGGHLAAAVALRARDEHRPPLAGQLLIYPMLDDRSVGDAAEDCGIPVWNRQSNRTSWVAYLGQTAEHPYGVPARARSFSRLPPAYIEVGSADLFRDECAAYAASIWSAGGRAELHVWAGAYHGFDHLALESNVATAALEARASWIDRILTSPVH